MPLRQVVDEVTRRWDTYYLLPAGSHYAGNAKVLDFWRDLLGQNAVVLDDLDAVCETIALTIGLGEQAIDLDEGLRRPGPRRLQRHRRPCRRRWPASAGGGGPRCRRCRRSRDTASGVTRL